MLDRLLAISALFQRDMHREFAGTCLTEARVHALWVLHHAAPISQQALVQALGTTPRSVSSLIDGLERLGLVARNAHPTDRRAVLVTLTAPGTALMTKMAEDHSRLSDELLSAVAEDDRGAFERGIDAVFRRLDTIVRGAGAESTSDAEPRGDDRAPGRHRALGNGQP